MTADLCGLTEITIDTAKWHCYAQFVNRQNMSIVLTVMCDLCILLPVLGPVLYLIYPADLADLAVRIGGTSWKRPAIVFKYTHRLNDKLIQSEILSIKRRNPQTSHPPESNKTHLFQYMTQFGTLYR